MDFGAISLAAFGAAILFAVLLQFILWLKVRYELKASVLEWKGVIENAVNKVNQSDNAFASFREAQARLEGTATALGLKQQALEESFAHFNAKTVARAREEAKGARREARSGEADQEARADQEADAFTRAVAEQQRLGLQPPTDKPDKAKAPRLTIKRFA